VREGKKMFATVTKRERKKIKNGTWRGIRPAVSLKLIALGQKRLSVAKHGFSISFCGETFHLGLDSLQKRI